MATYIIGDVQGCYQELLNLLDTINYDSANDRLGFVGDLVNRGTESLAVLRFIKSLDNPRVVLGNHDFYCLILGYGLVAEDRYHQTLHELLQASDKIELLDWLRHQPLVDADENSVLVHAGIPPQWSINQAIEYSREVEAALQGPNYLDFLKTVFGDEPKQWSESLTGYDRLRYIINALTQMRCCDSKGELDLIHKGKTCPLENFEPWFKWRTVGSQNIYFGHWAALEAPSDVDGIFALDTGCAWGRALTAIRLEDKKYFSVPSLQKI